MHNIPIDQIKPYEKNAKKHPAKQVEQIADSISEFGFNQPIVIDKGNVIIVGHGRYEAAKFLGLKEVPFIRLEDLTDEQVRAYRLADNKLNESEWDMGLVVDELKTLSDDLVDKTGFSSDLLIEQEDKDDFVPEVKTPISQKGDLYELGDHRVLCGDSTNAEDVARLMNSKKAELLFTSPPYSDMRDYLGGKDLSVAHLASFVGCYKHFCKFAFINLGVQRKGGEIFEYWNDYISAAKSCGYKFLSWNIWVKDTAGSIGNQSAMFPIEHEFIFVFGDSVKNINRTELKKGKIRTSPASKRNVDGSMCRNKSTGKIEMLKSLGTVFITPSEKTAIRKSHPATYPLALPQKFIQVMSVNSDIIVDPFLGSGSTLIASEKTNRICYGMELEPNYIDVIIQRYVDYTGNTNIIRNGKPFIWEKSPVKTI